MKRFWVLVYLLRFILSGFSFAGIVQIVFSRFSHRGIFVRGWRRMVGTCCFLLHSLGMKIRFSYLGSLHGRPVHYKHEGQGMSYIARLGPVGKVTWEVRGTVVNPGLICQTLLVPVSLIGLGGLCLLFPFSLCW